MVEQIAKWVQENKIELFKYVIFIVGIIVSFTNLFYCIVLNDPMLNYFMYFGIIFIGTILIVIVNSNIYLCFILALFGSLTIFYGDPKTISWGIVLILFSKRIADNKLYSVLIVFVSILIALGKNIFEKVSPSELLNVTVIYIAIYLMDYLLYNVKK